MVRLLQPTVARNGLLKAGTLAIGCFEDRPVPIGALEPAVGRRLRKAARGRAWRASAERRLELPVGPNDRVQTVLYGLGPAEDFDLHGLNGWIDRLRLDLEATAPSELLFAVPRHRALHSKEGAETVLRRLALLGYRFDTFRETQPATLKRVRVLPPAGAEAAYRAARAGALAVARGTALARELADTPPNRATPAWMAARARSVARDLGARARVLEPKELGRLGLHALLAVGRGSSNTPRLVRLEHGTRGPVVTLVGKGITFDTGGISLKPGAAMDEMKYDKSGACAVLGAFAAAVELDLPLRLRAYLALAENMPDGASYRPGDIIQTRSGKTVEILNTDAEGRLVLADALALAAEEEPSAIVELSTLTGATVVALGHHGAALYSPDDGLARDLLTAAEQGAERLWRMPLWPEFRGEMKGRHADLRNLGIRWGGANSAAAFVGEFMGECKRWAHLDIAGTAWRPAEAGPDFGATGYGVATVTRWLVNEAAKG